MNTNHVVLHYATYLELLMNTISSCVPLPPWQTLAQAVAPSYSHVFNRLELGLTPQLVQGLNCIEASFQEILREPTPEGVIALAQTCLTAAAVSDMKEINVILEVYRVLKVYSLTLRQNIEQARVERALFCELWHLVRRQIQAQLGKSIRPHTQVLFTTGTPAPEVFQAWCDGSFRQKKGYAGFVLKAPNRTVLSEVCLRVAATASHDTEVQSLRYVLATAVVLGIACLRVHVDAASLVSYLHNKPNSKPCPQRQALSHLLDNFEFFELVKVPRLYNDCADTLARKLKD